MSLLEVEDLVVRYGQLTAVRNVSLTLAKGEVAVLLGSNGAGKSSILNALSGVVPAAEGTIRFLGKDITRKPSHVIARSGLVQVPEGRRVIAPLTVRENLELGAHPVRSRSRRDALAVVVRDLFPELNDIAEKPSGLLSGGQQQMLAIGRALMADPALLMLDEPSMGLAPIVVDRVIEAIRAISATGISILMVEQNAAAAFDVATSAYVLEQGEVTTSGPVDSVRSSPLVMRAFLGVEASETTHQADVPPLTPRRNRP